ncbi:MAG: 16S rRNA (cytosine(967)-C(5))-methyltransferase RsmB [Verrucomicrobiales bacterium]
MSARRCTLDALCQWEETSRFAADILGDLATKHDLSGADRALAQELLFGVIRNLFFLDGLVDLLRKGTIKSKTRNLLRMGLFQLFKTDIAEHAAVNETVALARKHEKGLVNAVLRSAQRRRGELDKEAESWPLEDRVSHPAFLIERWSAEHGPDAAVALCEWNNRPPEVFARINPLAPDREALDRVRSETQPCLVGPEYPDFFRVEGPLNYDWLREGLIYIQDPATSLACRLLDPKPGETVLDACAAPGGKSALLAAMMNNEGTIVATDSSAPRIETLEENLSRLGAANVRTSRVDWSSPDAETLESLPLFDAILLDVPCSNTGVMRRRVDVRWRLQPSDFARHAEAQKQLLAMVRKKLAPGGRLVYSTCSIEKEENEAVVEEQADLAVEETVRSLPWRDGFDGAFAALLRA